MADIQYYFSGLAEQASGVLAVKHPDAKHASLQIEDTGQDVLMTTWQALAVHPLQALETGYQALSRALEATATTDQQRRNRATEALSRFFTLAGTAPQLLDLDIDDLAEEFRRTPLLDSEVTAIGMQLRLAKSLITKPAPPATAFGEMSTLVDRAVRVLCAMAPAGDPAAVAPGLRPAFEYLGLFAPHTAAEATAAWVYAHQTTTQPEDLQALAATLGAKLTGPLADPANAAASARCLYNIRSFYLFRLLHRFHGGSALAEMDEPVKQEAGGLVTAAMHPKAWVWLAAWHEATIADLAQRLRTLDQTLRTKFGRDAATLRFYLKGGRAMFTALGRPQDGANDWDTGILIDPALPPSDWYTAFAAVNDVVTLALDRLRYGYTQLMYQHENDLSAVPVAALVHVAPADDDDVADFTLLGAEADAMLRRSAAPFAPQGAVGLLSAAAVGAVVNSTPRPVGVNGELIDIGVATRTSVELRELWANLAVADLPGVSGKRIPVPQLGFFIDDFSTILREAIDTDGPADRKLAKRLQRLGLVLGSADPDLAAALALRAERLRRRLPNALEAMAPTRQAPSGRLQVWTLDALVQSLNPEMAARAGWFARLDAYLVRQVQLGAIYSVGAPVVSVIWAQIGDAFADDPDQGAAAREWLAILAGTHALAATIIGDFGRRETAFGIAGLGRPAPGDPWKTIAAVVTTLTSLSAHAEPDGSGALVVTGALAARLQLWQAGLDFALAAHAWPVELIDIELWLNARDLSRAEALLGQLVSRLGAFSSAMTFAVVGTAAQASLVVTAKSSFLTIPTVIDDPQPAVLVVRAVDVAGRSPRANDTINGWPVVPTRPLALQFLGRAAAAMDYDLRELAHGSANMLVDEVLGRQL